VKIDLNRKCATWTRLIQAWRSAQVVDLSLSLCPIRHNLAFHQTSLLSAALPPCNSYQILIVDIFSISRRCCRLVTTIKRASLYN
jgi:hypothetical protein